ncbi:MAG: hypothetical protein UT62_C0018G0001, partial [Parcubacteria group bacterium GW2011_GWC1_39_8]
MIHRILGSIIVFVSIIILPYWVYIPLLFIAIIIVFGSYLLTTGGQGLVFGIGDIYTLLMAASAAFIANILIKHTVSKMHPDLSAS